jgi:hypothetical protein
MLVLCGVDFAVNLRCAEMLVCADSFGHIRPPAIVLTFAFVIDAGNTTVDDD